MSTVTVRPRVLVGQGGTPLAEVAARLLRRVVVDQHAHLPDMFELTFGDRDGTTLRDSGLAIGTAVEVAAMGVATDEVATLTVGEVTAIEAVYDEFAYTVVRGYARDHRLQRTRRSRVFVNAKDSDIARDIAGEHDLTVGEITETTTAHDHVGQVNQTDWEFLAARAGAIGYEFGVVDGKFRFAPAATARRATVVPLRFPGSLRRFRPRVTAGNLARDTEVRVWDQAAAKAIAVVVPTRADGIAAGSAATPAAATTQFRQRQAPPPPAKGGPRDLGPLPSATAFVAATEPVARGAAAETAAREVATGLAGRFGATVAEAHGEADGDPRLRAGVAIEVDGIGELFGGRWVLTRATHTFDHGEYITGFEIGAGARTTFALSAPASERGLIPGVVCGVVSNVGDPDKQGRVRVALPWLSPRFETDWAVVAHPGAGTRGGAVFLPDVGDQVLVAFEFGDPRRPYVLGGLYDDHATHDIGGDPVLRKGESGAVVRRGVVSPTGNRLVFHDEVGPPPASSTVASEFVLGTAGGEVALAVDQVAGTLAVRCVPAGGTPGKLTIECGKAGVVEIRTGTGGEVTIGGGARLNLSATAAVKIESGGPVEIKGNPIKLN